MGARTPTEQNVFFLCVCAPFHMVRFLSLFSSLSISLSLSHL